MDYLDEDHQNFIKTRSGYITPVTYKVNYIGPGKSKSDIEFMCTFVPQQINQKYIYILTNTCGQILEMSSSAINFLGDQKSNIVNKKIMIDELIPKIFEDQEF